MGARRSAGIQGANCKVWWRRNNVLGLPLALMVLVQDIQQAHTGLMLRYFWEYSSNKIVYFVFIIEEPAVYLHTMNQMSDQASTGFKYSARPPTCLTLFR